MKKTTTRRKFATELKHIPLTDLCELSGWKTADTILTCYQQADPHTMRRLANARYLEPLGMLNIWLGYIGGRGTGIAPGWR